MSETAPPLAGRRAAVVNWRDLWHRSAGGSERYAWEYAVALHEAGAEVEFVTARDHGQSRREVVDDIRIRRRGGPFTFYAAAAAYLLRRRRTLDVVVDPETGIPVFSPLFVARSTAVVLVVHHVHQESFGEYFPPPLAWLGRTLEAKLMRRVYRGRPTVAVSGSTREEMTEQLGWREPVGLLMNGANLRISPTEDDHRPGRLVALGRLVPHKRVDVLIELVARLREHRPEVRLDILGRGPDEERLRELVRARGLDDVVTVHGYVTEAHKAELMDRAWLHLCASDREGWGQVVIEAAAFGVPTVARDVPGLRDSIIDGETGWLAPTTGPGDGVVDGLGSAVDDALTELDRPGRAEEVRRRCRERTQEFTWPEMHRRAVSLVVAELARRRDRHGR